MVRLQPDVLSALDTYADAHDAGATRPQAIREILTDWLATHGFMERGRNHREPDGPATQMVKEMDAAIARHRATKKRGG